MTQKLTMVSVTIDRVKYVAFVMLDAVKPVLSVEALKKIFPAYKKLNRGDTWSHG